MIVDLFAGPGGWSEGLRLLNGRRALGIELDRDAVATRRAAGHMAVRADVAALDPTRFADVEGVIASAPCPAFSSGGKKQGWKWLAVLIHAIRRERWDLPVLRRQDPTIWLPLEIGRWVEATRPTWIALEQVPPALRLWEAYREVFERWGYAVWCGVLNAADYGVPQTRKRAFLIASAERSYVAPPPPTHDKLGHEVGLRPWVSMLRALPELAELDETASVGFPRRDDRGDSADGYRTRDMRPVTEPAFSLTEKARSWRLNTGRRWKKGGTRADAQSVSVDAPAPTLAAESSRQWHLGPDRALLRVDQALAFQSFPRDYPMAGTRTSQFRQVGNAVPPLLARAVLGQVVP